MKLIRLLFLLGFIPVISLAQSFDKEVLVKSQFFQIKNGQVTEMDTILIQVNNREGEEDIQIPYSKGDKLSVGDVSILAMNGDVIRKLSSKEIKDRNLNSESTYFGDNFVKEFSLKHNVFPYKIMYSFRITYGKSFGADNVDCSYETSPIHKGILTIELGAEDSIKHKEFEIQDPQIIHDGALKRYTWKYSFTPSLIREKNAPFSMRRDPRVSIASQTFQYGIPGSFASWASYGNWIYRLNRRKDQFPAGEVAKIESLVRGIDEPVSRARALYHYLQDYTRYINVSLKLGGFQSYAPSYVSVNKYGDCKALTYYMRAMLQQVGIESFPVVIKAGDKKEKIDESFPASEFNHMILAVPCGVDTVFLECTAKNVPFGYLGTFTQNRAALLIKEDGSHIIHTPALRSEDVVCTNSFDVTLDDGQISLHSRLRGNAYEYLSSIAENLNRNESDIYIRKNIIPSTTELTSYNIVKSGRDTAEIRFEARLAADNLFQSFGRNLRIIPFTLPLPVYESPGNRKFGVELPYPEAYSDTITYKLGGREVIKLPDNFELSSKYGFYSLRFETRPSALICIKTLVLNAGFFPREEYDKFFAFMQTIHNKDHQTLFIETK